MFTETTKKSTPLDRTLWGDGIFLLHASVDEEYLSGIIHKASILNIVAC